MDIPNIERLKKNGLTIFIKEESTEVQNSGTNECEGKITYNKWQPINTFTQNRDVNSKPNSLSVSEKNLAIGKRCALEITKSKNTAELEPTEPTENAASHNSSDPKATNETESSAGPFNAVFINDSLSRTSRRIGVGRPVSMNRFTCNYCTKTFYHNSELTKHTRTHTGEKPFQCTYCDKRFGRKSILNAHVRIHTGERPYKCEYCDKRFKDLSNRSTHTRIHTNERPYNCTYCERQFYQRSNLIVHIRTHTGIKPYSCNYCDRQFVQRPDLKKHIRIHTGERPYGCALCGKRFSDKSTYNSHVKIHAKPSKKKGNDGSITVGIEETALQKYTAFRRQL